MTTEFRNKVGQDTYLIADNDDLSDLVEYCRFKNGRENYVTVEMKKSVDFPCIALIVSMPGHGFEHVTLVCNSFDDVRATHIKSIEKSQNYVKKLDEVLAAVAILPPKFTRLKDGVYYVHDEESLEHAVNAHAVSINYSQASPSTHDLPPHEYPLIVIFDDNFEIKLSSPDEYKRDAEIAIDVIVHNEKRRVRGY